MTFGLYSARSESGRAVFLATRSEVPLDERYAIWMVLLTGEGEKRDFIRDLIEQVNAPDLAIFAGVFFVVAFILFVARRTIDKAEKAQRFGRQLTMLSLTLVGIAAIVLALPVQTNLIQALLGMIGLVLSAVIALSATTFMGNAMAGFMLRSLRNFKAGDFIRCGEHFGRVTERGLVHTEIQTEDSDLTTLPNLFLVTNPLTTVRSTGTTVSATVSLGYDVPRTDIESCLLRAAKHSGLSDPFVQIADLGDFSVTYRIAGFSEKVRQLLTLRSNLRGAMMDELHAAQIEIVSPTFMNQRAVEGCAIPKPNSRRAVENHSSGRKVFDKADAAENYEFIVAQRDELEVEIKELQKLAKSEADSERKARLEKRIVAKESRFAQFERVVKSHDKKLSDE